MENTLIGADPELFLVNDEGKFISSIGRIGGSKNKPREIREDGCAVQEDNVAVEFNIPPSSTVDQFIEAVNFNLEYLRKHAQTQQLKLSLTASAVFSPDQLQHPKAVEFGCDADYNAWTGMRNPRPNATNPGLRSSGGHIHISTKLNPQLVTRACDLFIGVPSVLVDHDTKRRELYGKAGTFRPKKYGVEYRTPSNFWLQSEDLMRWIYGAAHAALHFTANDMEAYDFLEPSAAEIQECINTSDVKLAHKLMKDYGVVAA